MDTNSNSVASIAFERDIYIIAIVCLCCEDLIIKEGTKKF